MSNLTNKKTASELYALMDSTEIVKDVLGKGVDGLGKVGSLAINVIDLGNSYLEEEIEVREATKSMRLNIEKDKIAIKAFNRRSNMMDGVDAVEFEKFKADMLDKPVKEVEASTESTTDNDA